jgi:hypothetical protein
MDQLLTIGTGGLLTNNGGSAVNFLNGRMTAGTTANSTIYAFANNGTTQFLSRLENNGGGAVNFVKSGGATVSVRVEPRFELDSTTSATSLITSAGANSTGQAGVPGLVVGMGFAAAVMGIPASSVVTQVNSGITFTISQNVGTGTTDNSSQTFTAPVTQVLPNQTLTSGTNTITVPAGTILYPGQVVTTQVGATATLPANTTVLSISGTTVTLSNNIGGTTGNSTVLFAPVAAQTAPAPTLTAGTNTFTVAPNTLGLNVGQVVTVTGGTATLPANTIITSYNQGTGVVTLSNTIGGTTSAVTTANFAAPAERSTPTSTIAASTTAKVLSSVGMFVGQPIQGPGIPLGTTVAGIVDAKTITLSTAASATGTANA